MCRIRALVAEVAIQLEDLVETADDAALEEQFRRDTQVEIRVQGIGMGDERPRGGATGQRLQHGGLDLEEPAALEGRPDGTHDGDAGPGDIAGGRPHDQVHVALPHPGFLVHLLVRHRQRAQRLGGHQPGVTQHRQLPAPRTDHLAVHEHDVTEVDVGLPGLECLLAHAGEADHHLQLGAVAVLQRGETQLARVAGEHDPAGDAHVDTGLGVRCQLGIRGADLGQRVRARHRHRVRFATLGQQPVALVLPDPELFGKVSLAHVASA